MIDLIEVRSEAQIADVAHLAREIWCEHYVPIIGQEQVDYMLGKFQSERAITDQIVDAYEYYIVVQDEKSVGYMAVVPKMSEASLMLSKIYVKKSARGRGLGQKMLEFMESLCRQRNIKKMWLTVNKNNSHSISWYSMMGFINTASLIQDIGEGFVMDDYRMEKTIGQQAPQPSPNRQNMPSFGLGDAPESLIDT
jgi:ribosomal protein S18 acetylase RimI-like enzyme